jgi:hypothetical protein
MESVRRVTTTLEVNAPGAIVPLEFDLPSGAIECFGLQAIVVGLIPSVESGEIPDLGEYSLEFNGRREHPIHLLVPYVSAFEPLGKRVGYYPMSVALSRFGPVSGFYSDLDHQPAEFTPYRVRLAFNLIIQ